MEFIQKNPKIKEYKISRVICKINYVRILFEDTEDTMLLIAEGDCCSQNWFEEFDDVEILKGQNINRIEEDPFVETDKEQDECDETRIMYINNFKFKFRHTCNGYYSGWVRYELRNIKNKEWPLN